MFPKLTGKWKLELLYRMTDGSVRWSVFTHTIPGAAPNVLTRQLRTLELDGLAARIITNPQPPQVIEYALTQQGQTLVPILRSLAQWSDPLSSGYPDLSVAQRVVSGQWKHPILSRLHQPQRFGAIQAALGGISRGVLSVQLQELVELGLLEQKKYEVFPPRVEYVLTDRGRSLLEILNTIP